MAENKEEPILNDVIIRQYSDFPNKWLVDAPDHIIPTFKEFQEYMKKFKYINYGDSNDPLIKKKISNYINMLLNICEEYHGEYNRVFVINVLYTLLVFNINFMLQHGKFLDTNRKKIVEFEECNYEKGIQEFFIDFKWIKKIHADNDPYNTFGKGIMIGNKCKICKRDICEHIEICYNCWFLTNINPLYQFNNNVINYFKNTIFESADDNYKNLLQHLSTSNKINFHVSDLINNIINDSKNLNTLNIEFKIIEKKPLVDNKLLNDPNMIQILTAELKCNYLCECGDIICSDEYLCDTCRNYYFTQFTKNIQNLKQSIKKLLSKDKFDKLNEIIKFNPNEIILIKNISLLHFY